MSITFERELSSRREAIAAAGLDLAAWLDAEAVPAPAALLARLALEELATNVAMHGGGEDPERSIRVTCVASFGELVIRVDDDGPPFNPLDAPRADIDAPVEERRIGGLGIHLLRALSSRIAYERRDGRNCVTLVRLHEA